MKFNNDERVTLMLKQFNINNYRHLHTDISSFFKGLFFGTIQIKRVNLLLCWIGPSMQYFAKFYSATWKRRNKNIQDLLHSWYLRN